MNKTTSQKILEYIKNKGQTTGSELTEVFGISDRAIRKQLSNLLDNNLIYKVGKPPKVFYFLIDQEKQLPASGEITDKARVVINRRYLFISPAGERKSGLEGFSYWCTKNNLPLQKTANEYVATLAKYDKFKKSDLINGNIKLADTFKQVYLDDIYYLDFYSIERFGKTRLGQLLLYAKQSQNKVLMKEIITEIKPTIDKVIKRFKIDGLGYIPPTVKRETQLMKVLENGLNEGVRRVRISKIKTVISVPQKTLNKLADRIDNAKSTIAVEETSKFKNILLIDDAVGSGATLNETARKIRERGVCTGNIIGLALTGSFNGFDVISEV